MTRSFSFTQSPAPLYDNAWAHRMVKEMSLREKIGQLFVVAATSYNKINSSELVKSLIADYGIGGIIFLGSRTVEDQVSVTRELQQLSRIPLLITLDAEWGLGMRLKNGMSFPFNRELGKLNDTDLVYQVGKEIGRQLAVIGVHMNFAPVIDVDNNPLNPVIGKRSFGDDPECVAQNGIAYAQGLRDAGILACVKHFPGHGDTAADSHHELPKISHKRDRLDVIELYPFRQLIKHSIAAIMIAHLEVPALEPKAKLPTSLSYRTITDLLKHELRFEGLVITDGLRMRGASDHYKPGEVELNAFLAGNDILLCPLNVPKAVTLIEVAIKEGKVTEQDLDARVIKIMQAKAWAFTQQARYNQDNVERDIIGELFTPEAYALKGKVT